MKETRKKRILDLLSNDMEWHSSQELAVLLEVSAKTVRVEIRSLNRLLFQHGARIEMEPGKGCHFEISDSQKFESFLRNEWWHYAFETSDYNNPDYRVESILKWLIFSRQYVKYTDLEEEFLISTSQIHHDLKRVRSILSGFHLSLHARPHYGLIVEGSEWNRRQLMAEHFIGRKENNTVAGDPIFLEETAVRIREAVLSILDAAHFPISDFSFHNLVIHLQIAAYRIKNGSTMDAISQEEPLETAPEYQIAERITGAMEELLQLRFPTEETRYITIHLLGKRMVHQETPSTISNRVQELVQEMLEEIFLKLGFDFRKDLDLMLSLSTHLVPLLERLKYGLVLRNPLLSDIHADYLSWESARIAATVLESYSHRILSQDEIGYLAFHFSVSIHRKRNQKAKKRVCIICATGLGTALLMKQQFLDQFAQSVETVDVMDVLQAQKSHLTDYDLLLTSVALPFSAPIPVVEVGVFFESQDVQQIENQLEQIPWENVKALFDPRFFIREKEPMRTPEAVLSQMTDRAKELRPLKGDLYREMIKREELGATAYGAGVALPHPMNPVSSDTFFGVYLNPQGIPWGSELVRVVLLLQIGKKADRELLLSFFTVLDRFLSDASQILKAAESKSMEEFLGFLDPSP